MPSKLSQLGQVGMTGTSGASFADRLRRRGPSATDMVKAGKRKRKGGRLRTRLAELREGGMSQSEALDAATSEGLLDKRLRAKMGRIEL